MVNKQMKINEKLKKKLDRLKIHKRETYGDVIERLIKNYKNQKPKQRLRK